MSTKITLTNRQGIKVARWIEKKLKDSNYIVCVIDPLELNLPLLDKMYKEMTNPTQKITDLRDKINNAEDTLPSLLNIIAVHQVH
jgi:NAD(P)H-dependent FMN reductase